MWTKLNSSVEFHTVPIGLFVYICILIHSLFPYVMVLIPAGDAAMPVPCVASAEVCPPHGTCCLSHLLLGNSLAGMGISLGDLCQLSGCSSFAKLNSTGCVA